MLAGQEPIRDTNVLERGVVKVSGLRGPQRPLCVSKTFGAGAYILEWDGEAWRRHTSGLVGDPAVDGRRIRQRVN